MVENIGDCDRTERKGGSGDTFQVYIFKSVQILALNIFHIKYYYTLNITTIFSVFKGGPLARAHPIGMPTAPVSYHVLYRFFTFFLQNLKKLTSTCFVLFLKLE